jgi:hypothetical protein
VDRHFGGVGARDEIGRAEQVEVLFFGEPLAATDNLVVEQRDVRGRPAERGQAEAKEERGDFEQR